MIVEELIQYIGDRKFVYQIVGSFVTYYVIKIIRFINCRRKKHALFREYGIPGPKPSLLDGNLSDYRKADTFYKMNEALIKEYGNLFGVYFGDEASVISTDLDFLKKVFFEQESTFTERSHIFITSPLTKGILFARYPRWKVMRKVLAPSFNAFAIRGSSATQFIEDSLRLMIKYIDERLTNAQGQRITLDIQDLMKATSLHLISAMAIKLPNVQVKENEENVKSLDGYLSMSDKGAILWAIRFPFVKSILQFLSDHFEHNKLMSAINKQLDKIIDENLVNLTNETSQNRAEKEQVINTLIRLHAQGKLTRDEVVGNAEALLFAGYDTTSTTLAYIFWVLAKNPDIQQKLRDELMAHGLESKYLSQVLNETMRLYPTVTSFTTRVANQTVKINQWTIPKNTRVVYNAWLMHRHPDLWPEPEKFDPSRFEEGNEIHPCAFAPFGLGDRRCLGYQLALLEMKMITCDIILRYKLHLLNPQELNLVTYAGVLTKSKEKITIELERFRIHEQPN